MARKRHSPESIATVLRRVEAGIPIGAFILDYNLDRSHSSLGKRSPAEFERMHYQAALSQPVQAELSVP